MFCADQRQQHTKHGEGAAVFPREMWSGVQVRLLIQSGPCCRKVSLSLSLLALFIFILVFIKCHMVVTSEAPFLFRDCRNHCRYSLHPPTEGWPGWVGLSGLDKYQDGRPAKGCYHSQYTNRVRHSLTSFLRWMLLPLCQTSHQGCWGMSGQLLIMGWFLIVCASSRPLKFKFHLSLHDTTCYLAHAFCPKNSSTCCVCSVVLAWI